MDTAPLIRDLQIELMVSAKERHAAHVARWISDEQVREVIRQQPLLSGKSEHAYLRKDERILRCG